MDGTLTCQKAKTILKRRPGRRYGGLLKIVEPHVSKQKNFPYSLSSTQNKEHPKMNDIVHPIYSISILPYVLLLLLLPLSYYLKITNSIAIIITVTYIYIHLYKM